MRLAKAIMSYSAINVISAAVPFFLLPILTAYLLPSEFGELSLVLMLQALLMPLVLINFNGLIPLEYSRLDQEQFSRLVGTILWLPLIGGGAIVLPLFLLQDEVAELFHIPPFWVTASIVVVLLQALPMLISSLLQAEQNPKAYGAFKISLTLMNFALSIFFVVGLKCGWEGRVWGVVGAFALFSGLSLFILQRKQLLSLVLDPLYFCDALKFGIPLIPHIISGTLLAMVDRLFQANMLTPADVGLYSVAFQVATAVVIVMSSINQAWSPHLFQKLNSAPTDDEKQKLVVQTYKIMGGMLAVALCFIAATPVIYKYFIASAYQGGMAVTMLIAVAMLFQGFYFMVTNYIFYVKKTHMLSVMTLLSVVVIVLLNYTLIPSFGIKGSVYAMMVSWLVLFLLAWRLAHHLYPMPWFLVSLRKLS